MIYEIAVCTTALLLLEIASWMLVAMYTEPTANYMKNLQNKISDLAAQAKLILSIYWNKYFGSGRMSPGEIFEIPT